MGAACPCPLRPKADEILRRRMSQPGVKPGQALSGSGEGSALNAKVALAADVAVAAGLGVR